MAKPKKRTTAGVVGSVVFEGWGRNSGQAQVVINRNMAGEKRFLLGVTGAGSLTLFEKALKAMWSGNEVEIAYKETDNLPVLTGIE